MKNTQTSGKMNRRRLLQQASATLAAPLMLGSVSAAEVGNPPFTTQVSMAANSMLELTTRDFGPNCRMAKSPLPYTTTPAMAIGRGTGNRR